MRRIVETILVWSVAAIINTEAMTPKPIASNDGGVPAIVAQSSISGKLRISWKELRLGIRPQLEYLVHYTTDPSSPISKWNSIVVCNSDTTLLHDLMPSTFHTVRLEARLKDSNSPWPVYIPFEVKTEPDPDEVAKSNDLPESEQQVESNMTESKQNISSIDSRIEKMEIAILERLAKLETIMAKMDSRMDLLENVAKALSTGKCELNIVHPPRRMTCLI